MCDQKFFINVFHFIIKISGNKFSPHFLLLNEYHAKNDND